MVSSGIWSGAQRYAPDAAPREDRRMVLVIIVFVAAVVLIVLAALRNRRDPKNGL